MNEKCLNEQNDSKRLRFLIASKKYYRKTALIGIILVAVFFFVFAAFQQANSTIKTWRVNSWLDLAAEQAALGAFEAAEQSALKASQINPERQEALLATAQYAFLQSNYQKVLEYLARIDESLLESLEGEDAKFYSLSAIASQKLFLLSQAESYYRRWIEIAPEQPEPRIELVKTLSSSGRRDEAIPHVLELIRIRSAGDLVMLLARESGAIDNREQLEKALGVIPEDSFAWAALAFHAFENNELDRAKSLANEALQRDPTCLSAIEVILQVIEKTDGTAAALQFLSSCTAELQLSIKEKPTVWRLLANHYEDVGEVETAIRCYLELFLRRPGSQAAVGRLSSLLSQQGYVEQAEAFKEQLKQMQSLRQSQDRTLFASSRSTSEDWMKLLTDLLALGRVWEAYGWLDLLEQTYGPQPAFERKRQTLESQLKKEPLSLVSTDRVSELTAGLDRFPLPAADSVWESLNVQDRTSTADSPQPPNSLRSSGTSTIQFVENSEEVGVRFQFSDGTQQGLTRRILEFTGGGIGVIDYDLDGWDDVVFTQGLNSESGVSNLENEKDLLIRNLGGKRFASPIPLPLKRDAYGQGIAIGDVNDDGFPDIYIAQTTENRLLINSGDGTFFDATEEFGISGEAWTTSCVIADFNGDGFNDIYDVNYLQGSDVFTRVCNQNGLEIQCKPSDFEPARDRLWLNDGQGRFIRHDLPEIASARGLGATAFSMGDSGHQYLFVANDTDPNFLLKFSRQDNGVSVDDLGLQSGIALNRNGKAEGSMGIAAADLNGNGFLDFFVTNFLAETNTLYLSRGEGLFQDQTQAFGLEPLSYDWLGFGTQFFDANLDGILEVFIANGHVDDLRALGKPYKMSQQLLTRDDSKFVNVDSPGDYFRESRLGRAVAKVDWNRDQRIDLWVGHLREPYALLTNQSETRNPAVTLRLVGRKSNRDAIGATVTLVQDGQSYMQQVTSGDGYHCSNTRALIFPLNTKEEGFFLIRWPSGTEQRIEIDSNFENQTLILVEPF